MHVCRAALFHAAVFGVTVALPLWYLPSLPLWEARQADEPEDADWSALRREDAFYAQPVLLERALESVEPERMGSKTCTSWGWPATPPRMCS